MGTTTVLNAHRESIPWPWNYTGFPLWFDRLTMSGEEGVYILLSTADATLV